jgi:FKBP-type peptidyl-prolyl cis-trans isomerase SlyD
MKNAMIVDGKQVTLLVKMYDSQGELVGAPEQPMVYVHGADQIFKKLEEVLAGKAVGDSVSAYLQPEEHFGDYDADLVRVEERDKFPSELEVGMQFEAESDDTEEEPMVVTVTDVTDEGVVLDGNHPLAGMALRFDMVVQEIGEPEVLDEVVDEEDNTEFREVRRTLH